MDVGRLYLGSNCANLIGDNVEMDPCEAEDDDWCCYYTSSQLGDGPVYSSYVCALNPDFWEGLFDDVEDLVSEVTTDDAEQYSTEAYCAFSVMAKVSVTVLAVFVAFYSF